MRLRDFAPGQLNELSPATLASYKKKAGAAATAADAAGDTKTGNKRFSGIVKATKKQFDQDAKGVAEADDSKFVGFMNKTMSNKVDAPKADTLAGAPDFYRNAAVSTLDARQGFKNALKFGLKALSRLDPETKQQLAAGSEQAVEEYLTDVAERSGQMGDDTFVEEDISEVQDYLSDVFHDPSINSWKDVLQQSRGVTEDSLAGMKRLAGIASVRPQTTPGQRQYRHMPTAVQPR
jgi:hypothetical protein